MNSADNIHLEKSGMAERAYTGILAARAVLPDGILELLVRGLQQVIRLQHQQASRFPIFEEYLE